MLRALRRTITLGVAALLRVRVRLTDDWRMKRSRGESSLGCSTGDGDSNRETWGNHTRGAAFSESRRLIADALLPGAWDYDTHAAPRDESVIWLAYVDPDGSECVALAQRHEHEAWHHMDVDEEVRGEAYAWRRAELPSPPVLRVSA